MSAPAEDTAPDVPVEQSGRHHRLDTVLPDGTATGVLPDVHMGNPWFTKAVQ